jgi:Photosynthetic reaction centre cytochrome C subunit
MSNFRLRLIAMCLVAMPLVAQDAAKQDAAKQDTAKKGPPPPPTNLKVLKVTTGAEVSQIMRTFTAALGVQCAYCHMAGNYASDENPKKDIARKMIRMTQQINTNFPDSKMYVSCYTCHRGDAQPKTAPEPKAGG